MRNLTTDGRGCLAKCLETFAIIVIVYSVGVTLRIICKRDALAGGGTPATDGQTWKTRWGNEGWDLFEGRRPAMKRRAVTVMGGAHLVFVMLPHPDTVNVVCEV